MRSRKDSKVEGVGFPQLKRINSEEFLSMVRAIKGLSEEILAQGSKHELLLRRISRGV